MKVMRYNNEYFPEYRISKDGEIFDYKNKRYVKVNYVCKSKNSCYARASIRNNKSGGNRLTILVHIAVCDTYNRHTLPVPEGVTQEEWDRTPESVKDHIRFSFQVNHIDHDQHNHHPSNLEYTTAKQNQAAYQIHRKAKEKNL